MTSRQTQVRAHVKRDGTAVKTHLRRLNPFVARSMKGPDVSALLDGGQDSLPQIERTPVKQQREAYKTSLAVEDSRYNNIIGMSSIGVMGGTLGAMLSIFGGGPIAAAGLIAATGVSSIMMSLITKRPYSVARKTFHVPDLTPEEKNHWKQKFPHDRDAVAANRFTPREEKQGRVIKADGIRQVLRIDRNGLGSLEWSDSGKRKLGKLKLVLSPKVKLGKNIPFSFHAPGANLAESEADKLFVDEINLRGANLQNANWEKVVVKRINFDNVKAEGINLEEADFYAGTMCDADLRGANLRGAKMGQIELQGSDLSGADVTGAVLNRDLRGVELTREQFQSLGFPLGYRTYIFDKMDFYEAIEKINLSEKQFEFLILSGAIQVVDPESGAFVEKDFDPEKHRIPLWEVKRLQKQHGAK